MERSLVLVKPDAVQREHIGTVISTIEQKGLKIVGMKMTQLSDEILLEHYSHIADNPFFGGIKKFMQSTPVVAIAVEGAECVDTLRRIVGPTLARNADAGTIRGSLGMSIQCNLVHASDSLEAAKTELTRFFEESEILEYDKVLDKFIYSSDELKS